VSQSLRPFGAKQSKEDLVFLKALVESGQVTPAIDRTYPLSETAEAMRYFGEEHARAKVVIMVKGPGHSAHDLGTNNEGGNP
jgi:NADPH:quinone reductase-like Zn-dependent oxidoreductase